MPGTEQGPCVLASCMQQCRLSSARVPSGGGIATPTEAQPRQRAQTTQQRAARAARLMALPSGRGSQPASQRAPCSCISWFIQLEVRIDPVILQRRQSHVIACQFVWHHHAMSPLWPMGCFLGRIGGSATTASGTTRPRGSAQGLAFFQSPSFTWGYLAGILSARSCSCFVQSWLFLRIRICHSQPSLLVVHGHG